jgi:hypothetical protein
MQNPGRALRALAVLVATATLSGCIPGAHREARVDPDVARAQIEQLLPAKTQNRSGWAVDIFAAFEALQIPPSVENTCAVIAVTEQESTFQENPRVPGLSGIATKQIEAKASDYGIPRFVVNAALETSSTNGSSYRSRLERAKTEKELSEIYEDLIGRVPLGKRLFGNLNPVRTGGPMQVSIAYAEKHATTKRYPYPVQTDIRAEVFSRRGGMYFGIAHLLDYRMPYSEMIYRFADFNAGHYASRNAGFQNAVNVVARTKLDLDGDVLLHGERAGHASNTELALRKVSGQLRLSEAEIRSDLERSQDESFGKSKLYQRVFEIADAAGSGRPMPRAMMPNIRLKSPKIQRKLTTGWFANRVQTRYEQCLARARTL